jgi:hypothetical protein
MTPYPVSAVPGSMPSRIMRSLYRPRRTAVERPFAA